MGIRVNLLVPVGLTIFFLLNGLRAAAVMLFAAAVHEMGHILCANAVKAPIMRFDVELWGGRMFYGGMLSYKQELVVALGGIAANLLAAPLGLIPIFGVYGKLFYYSCFCYALINIVPAKTLDGGEVLRCLLRLCGEQYMADRAEYVVHVISVLFVATAGFFLCVLAGFNSSVMFLVLLSVAVLVTETHGQRVFRV